MNPALPPPGLDIRPEQWALVRSILRLEVPEYTVWAFGSRTQGRARPYSDLDLVIHTDRPLGLARLAALAEAFSESDLPWRVDIVDWCSAGEPFRQIIARDRVPVQEAPRNHDSQSPVAHGTAGP